MKRTICIAGKNNIAVDVLLYCIKVYSDYRIVCILNRNERGINTWQKSLKFFAEKNNIEIISLEDSYDINDIIFLSIEFDRIIDPNKFHTKELYNIHFSLLPKYKGCYPSVLPILYGDKVTGVTLHRMQKGIDTGEIIAQQEIVIDNNDNSFDLYNKLSYKGAELIISFMPQLLSGRISAQPQSKEDSTYYSSSFIDFNTLVLDLNKTAFQIRNQIRAFAFRPYQTIEWNGNKYIDVEISDEQSINPPGTILEDNDVFTVISTIDYNALLIKDTLEQVLYSIEKGDNKRAIQLCYSMKNLNAKNSKGWTPLIVAVYNNNYSMVEYLINRGADITIVNNNGTNLLMYAKDCFICYKDSSIFEYLIDLGLSIETKDYNEKSLIDYCKEIDMNYIGSYKIY